MGVELTKQAVATRLLRASVRSYLRREDIVATYLLASAAGRLLADLLDKAGIDWLAFAIQRGVWYWARDYHEGHYEGPAELAALIDNIALGIAYGTVAEPTDIVLHGLDPSLRRSLHAIINRQYNFLKHADRDALASVAEEDIDLFSAIARTCVLFQDLYPKVDVEEVYLFKYLVQRKNGVGFSPDVEPYPSTFDAIDDVDIEGAILSYLEFEG